jgi:hypothetical protein
MVVEDSLMGKLEKAFLGLVSVAEVGSEDFLLVMLEMVHLELPSAIAVEFAAAVVFADVAFVEPAFVVAAEFAVFAFVAVEFAVPAFAAVAAVVDFAFVGPAFAVVASEVAVADYLMVTVETDSFVVVVVAFVELPENSVAVVDAAAVVVVAWPSTVAVVDTIGSDLVDVAVVAAYTFDSWDPEVLE